MGSFQGSIVGSLLTLLGWDGSAFQNILVDSDGHLQVDALTSQLITGFGTAANQTELLTRIGPVGVPVEGTVNRSLADIKTAVRLIDDLYGALHSVSTDELLAYVARDADGWMPLDIDTSGRLLVAVNKTALAVNAATEVTLSGISDKIPDQLLGYTGTLGEEVVDANATAGTFTLESTAVVADVLHIVTAICMYDATSATTDAEILVLRSGVDYTMRRVATLAASEGLDWSGMVVLKAGDQIRARWKSVILNDTCFLQVVGWKASI